MPEAKFVPCSARLDEVLTAKYRLTMIHSMQNRKLITRDARG